MCVVIFVVTAIVAVLLPGGADPSEPDADHLPTLAGRHGLEVGTAVAVNPLVHDDEYQRVITDNYTSVTAENAMKWQHVQPERGEFDWSGPDTIVGFADDHDLSVRGHTLLWHNQLPSWLADGSWEAGELREVLREHTESLVGRYQGRVTAWDVINEPFEDGEPELRENIWHRTLGEDYIAEALRLAHEVDPEAKLYINEFNIEGGGDKADALYELAQDLLDRDVPLHGIGFQSHFVHDQVPENMAEEMRRFTDLGLEVTVTEVDIRIPEPATEENLAAQGQEYKHVMQACLDVPRCVGVTTWGVADHHSWIPEWFPGFTAALPFDEDYAAKPARTGMVEALSRRRRAGRETGAR